MSEPGLRERKKLKTRWAIQEHALRLFAEQGYDATTVDQIAAAAEISPSTFFRYFKTKEDVVIEDEYDPMIEDAIRAAPADLPPLAAVRRGLATLFGQMPAEEKVKAQVRGKLIMAVPALRARSMENYLTTRSLLASAVGQRLDVPATDFRVQILTGAVIGALVAVLDNWMETESPDDLGELIDRAMAILEAGFPYP